MTEQRPLDAQTVLRHYPWLMRPLELVDRAVTAVAAPRRERAATRRPGWPPDTIGAARAINRTLGRVGLGAYAPVRGGVVGRVDWEVRRFAWSLFWGLSATYSLRPKRVPVPREEPPIRLVPPSNRHSDFQAPAMLFPDRVTEDESSAMASLTIEMLHFLQDVYPIIKPGQPPASPDPATRVARAYPLVFRLVRPAPVWHHELAEAHAAGRLLPLLAVGGPFAKLLERRAPDSDEYVIDLGFLDRYPVRPGLTNLGCRVNFVQRGSQLDLVSIEHGGRTLTPGDEGFALAHRVVECALITHVTVWRHGMQYHAGGTAPMMVASHNLPPDHPIRRLLAEHVHENIFTNYHTHVTLRRSGFDVTAFSFSFETILRYYDDGVRHFDIERLDPRLELPRRGIPESLDYPYRRQALTYFGLIEDYVREYVSLYYRDDDAVRRDPALGEWFAAIDAQTPNGVRHYISELTCEGLVRLCALYIYLVTFEHQEHTLWEYLAFLPTFVPADGTEQSVGAVQSTMNFLFVIASAMNKIIEDRSYLALDEEGAAVMRRFKARLADLQREYDAEPNRWWSIPPAWLDASVSS